MLSRFMQEVTGILDEQLAERNGEPNNHYWQRSAYVELDKALKMVREEAIVEDDGAIRWKSNGSYLMDDLCEKLEWAGYNFDRKLTGIKRDIQIDLELEEYRKRPHIMTDEELYEARAAFGAGTVLVDIISGNKITL